MSDEQVRKSARYHGVTGETNILAADLLEARELIREMREVFKEISEKSIAFVCEDVRERARIQIEKTKEYV